MHSGRRRKMSMWGVDISFEITFFVAFIEVLQAVGTRDAW